MIDVRYHEAAEAELFEALGFLELRAKGLGRRLLREVQRTLARIEEFPQIGPEIRPGVHKLPIRSFRYSLVYAIDEQGVLILALAHGSRRPDYPKKSSRCPPRAVSGPRMVTRCGKIPAMPGPVSSTAGAIRGR